MRILRGRLVFAEAQIYGRLSGLHMQNLSRWEHAVGDTLLDDDLRRSLEFVRDGVVKGGPRMVDSAMGEVFYLYTDACYENCFGGLGGVLFDPTWQSVVIFLGKGRCWAGGHTQTSWERNHHFRTCGSCCIHRVFDAIAISCRQIT